jgi:hypothetical protein
MMVLTMPVRRSVAARGPGVPGVGTGRGGGEFDLLDHRPPNRHHTHRRDPPLRLRFPRHFDGLGSWFTPYRRPNAVEDVPDELAERAGDGFLGLWGHGGV